MWPWSRRTTMFPTTAGHQSLQKNFRGSRIPKPASCAALRITVCRRGKTWYASVLAYAQAFAFSKRVSRQLIGSALVWGVSLMKTTRDEGAASLRKAVVVRLAHSRSDTEFHGTESL